MRRSLIWHGRLHLAVLAAAATTTAVLTGALLVGDSLRGSLRSLATERLGRIEHAALADRFFDASAADRVAEDPGGPAAAAPAILLRGSAALPDGSARASRVAILGIDSRFDALFPGREGAFPPPAAAGGPFPPATVNETLARALPVAAGDTLLVTFPRWSDAPRESLLGRREPEHVVGTLRVTVARVTPDAGAGGFSLEPHQGAPASVFLAAADLQAALGLPDRANAILASGFASGRGGLEPALRGALRLGDLGYTAEIRERWVEIASRAHVVPEPSVATLERAARSAGAGLLRVRTYLANEIRLGARAVPWSTVTALGGGDPAFGSLTLAGGGAAPPPREGEILLGEWAAADLGARRGDVVSMSHYVVGPRDELETATRELRVAGIVSMEGLGGDRGLTPAYPGIQGARHMSEWDPPFPVRLDAIRPADEAYWDRHGATPKAFLAEEDARRFFESRYGTLTSLRLAPPAGVTPGALAGRFEDALLRSVPLEASGFRIRRVREDAGRAAEGATDFGGLFVGFSLFLIASAAMLTGLLFRLGIELRAPEIGLLSAVGWPARRVAARFLLEGGLVGLAGCALGVLAGRGYASLMVHGLRTLWQPAVGTSRLEVHAPAATLALGGIASGAIVLAAIAWSVRRLGRLPAIALLRGVTRPAESRHGTGRARTVSLAASLAALLLLAAAVTTGRTASPLLSFGLGASLLVAGLSAFALRLRAAGRGRSLPATAASFPVMAARNGSWRPGRSLLSVSLVACAAFILVTVAASRRVPGSSAARDSGSGGFALVAETGIPVYQDLNRRVTREDLGLPDRPDWRAFGLRSVPGDDVSCLNLYRPSRPRLLGASEEWIARGGFRFVRADAAGDNPWRLLEEDLGEGVVPAIGDAASVRWILHSDLGGEIPAVDEEGRPIRLRFVALLVDSLFQSDLIVSEKALDRHFPSRGGASVFLLETAPGDAAPLARALEERLAGFGLDAVPVSERLAAFLAVETTYLSTFRMLGGLGLLLGTIGLAVVLARNVLERRAEFAILRAFGFPRGRIAALVVGENMVLLLAGLAIGAIAGLGAVAPRLVSGESEAPWAALAATFGAVALAGLVSSLAAVAGAVRAPILAALRAER